MSPDIKNLISLIFTTSRLIREKGGQEENICPHTYLQLGTLKYIMDHDNSTMKDIAVYLSITAPSATSLVNGLVKSKQIERVVDESDRRVIRLHITTAGKVTLKQGFNRISKRLHTVLEKLNKEEIKNFLQILEKIHKAYS